MTKKCCGNCEWWHPVEDISGRKKIVAHDCNNLESDNYADLTEYEHHCEGWEERE